MNSHVLRKKRVQVTWDVEVFMSVKTIPGL